MAEIVVKMGVNAPGDDVDDVLKVLDYIYQQDPSTDDSPFSFSAYEEDFSDGAVGVLASMTFILNYLNESGEKKQYISHVLKSFERIQIAVRERDSDRIEDFRPEIKELTAIFKDLRVSINN